MNDDELAAQIARLKVEDILVGTASTLASVAFAKLEAKDREQAKRAIDALTAIVPLLEDAGLKRDLNSALANLQVAYASQP